MAGDVLASRPSFSSVQSVLQRRRCSFPVNSIISTSPLLHRHSLSFSVHSLNFAIRFSQSSAPRSKFPCNSSTSPGAPGPGENESRIILDAFFLGKAFGEALSERIESTVGEFLSTIGRLQAEQQKQIQEFQEDVLERAKRVKEKAAREATEEQALISESTTVYTSSATNGPSSTSILSGTGTGTPGASSPAASPNGPTTIIDQDHAYRDPLSGVSTDSQDKFP
ncbi:hypothetical protein Ancab_019805 [Ancistrocladus abbreviatus]